jgi:hypothetical protein
MTVGADQFTLFDLSKDQRTVVLLQGELTSATLLVPGM